MPFIVQVVVCDSKIESFFVLLTWMVKSGMEQEKEYKIKYQYVNAWDAFPFLLPIAVLSWRWKDFQSSDRIPWSVFCIPFSDSSNLWMANSIIVNYSIQVRHKTLTRLSVLILLKRFLFKTNGELRIQDNKLIKWNPFALMACSISLITFKDFFQSLANFKILSISFGISVAVLQAINIFCTT